MFLGVKRQRVESVCVCVDVWKCVRFCAFFKGENDNTHISSHDFGTPATTPNSQTQSELLGRFAASPYNASAACRRPWLVEPGAPDTVKSKICRSPACSRHLVMLLLVNSTGLLNRVGGMPRSAFTARPRSGRVISTHTLTIRPSL